VCVCVCVCVCVYIYIYIYIYTHVYSLYSKASIPALSSIQPPAQWVLGTIYPMQPGRETDHSHPVPMLRMRGVINSTPSHAFVACTGTTLPRTSRPLTNFTTGIQVRPTYHSMYMQDVKMNI